MRWRWLVLSLICAQVASNGCSSQPPAATVPRPGTALLRNTIRWTIASDLGSFGYDVYRGDGDDGPFERLTSLAVTDAGAGDGPHSYEFVDDTIEPGRAYYYYVEEVRLNGGRRRLTPIKRAPPKELDEKSALPP